MSVIVYLNLYSFVFVYLCILCICVFYVFVYFMYLYICVFMYLCICVFVYLCICVFYVFVYLCIYALERGGWLEAVGGVESYLKLVTVCNAVAQTRYRNNEESFFKINIGFRLD